MSTFDDPRAFDAIVAGDGVIGLVTAWRAAQRGLGVALVGPGLANAASDVAAGMLTPATEATFGEEALMSFGILSRDRYPDFIEELRADSGTDPGYRTEGTLQVAFDSDDMASLNELRELRERLGLDVQRLTSRECRRMEPMLAPSVRGGIFAPADHSIDPRRLTAALRSAAAHRGVTVVEGRVRAVTGPEDRVNGVELADGTHLRGDQVVLAAGVWTSRITGLPPDTVPALRPVKGQLLRLRGGPHEAPLVTRTVRGLVKGTPVYLVARNDGEVILGGTQEEVGHDTRLTAGGVWQLLRDGHELVPGVSELEITETCVGLRPGSPDNEPLLGPTAVAGLHLAVGHFRHGVLCAPATGDAMAEALAQGRLPDYAQRFHANRLAPQWAPTGREA
ncbi:glycine oxidase ThiO [Salinactinospora qingdaonensis]|uniref:glycine oxidase n=1 Tax=Salinactinospora qingdaonensis TaxID=702744 RepID=A0ABP7FEK1_9ACTN